MIRAASPSELSQGTIFTCALAENYPIRSVRGVIITARCDTAHEKVDIFNYIPVVPLEEWMLFDGRILLARGAAANASAALRKTLVDAGLAPAILDAVPATTIAEELSKDTSKQGRAIVARFEKARTTLEEATSACAEHVEQASARAYLNSIESACKTLIKQLTENQLSDFYFLDRCEPLEACNGYVALLREIRFIPARLGKAIAVGLDLSTYEATIAETPRADGKLRIETEDDFAMPVGAVESPYIELLMQRLTLLFARIGVTDIEPSRLRSVQQVVDGFKVMS